MMRQAWNVESHQPKGHDPAPREYSPEDVVIEIGALGGSPGIATPDTGAADTAPDTAGANTDATSANTDPTGATVRPWSSSPTILRLDLGPDHPTRPGLVRIMTKVEGGRISRARVEIGHLHRGVEKLFEVRDHRQIPVLASRHDWQAPFVGEVGSCVVIERAAGIEVPARAAWLRTALFELTRIMSHLSFLAWVPHRADDSELSAATHRSLESVHELWRRYSGNRVHPMVSRVGGLAVDLDAEVEVRWRSWLDEACELAGRLTDTLADPALRGTASVGVIEAALVDPLGLSGPVARASGIDLDLRRHPGHLAHDAVDVPTVQAPTTGDARARLTWLAREIPASASICRQVLDGLPSGPIQTRLPATLKIPVGTTWSTLEAPWGRADVVLVSRGGTTPWRLALRTPTFADVQALEHVLVGAHLEDVEPIIASLGWTLGDLDK